MTTTAIQATDTEHATHAVARLTEAIALLRGVAGDMTILAINDTGIQTAVDIARFARAAAEQADTALMVATNELKLAQRDQS